MKSERSFVFNFYVPIIVSLSLVLVAAVGWRFFATGTATEFKVGIPAFGFKLEKTIAVERIQMIRLYFVLAAFASLVPVFRINFSDYLPKQVKLRVCFDPHKLQRRLQDFSRKERAKLKIAGDWLKRIAAYDAEVKTRLFQLWELENRAPPDPSVVVRDRLRAEGEANFDVKRVRLMHYRIRKNDGRLFYVVDVPSDRKFDWTRWEWEGKFNLKEDYHVRPDVWSLIKSCSVVISPTFEQTFSLHEGPKTPFDHDVIGVTKIRLLPFPGFRHTVYLWKPKGGEKTVPIAYSEYFPPDD